ncbi:MAG: sigma-54 dependent transcriptional regulator [Kofleriaceae bacterium]
MLERPTTPPAAPSTAGSDRPRVIIADDTAANRRLMNAVFRAHGFDPIVVDSGAAAIDAARAELPALALLDLQMPGMGGIEALTAIRAFAPGLPILILTAYGEIPVAVEAIRLGANDFLTRPIENEELVRAVRRAIAGATEGGASATSAGASAAPPRTLEFLMGPSEAVAQVARLVKQVAATDVTALVLGETGTGKELVARALHEQSERHDQPLISVDCGAIPDNLLESELFGYERGAFSGADRRKEGRFEQAGGGTLFLDEIGNLSSVTQAKLLRVLQERQLRHLGGTRTLEVKCRVIAATNEDLMQRVEDGRFRADLYYRLAEFIIRLPPLRDRPGDVEALAGRFAVEASSEFRRTPPSLTPAALAALEGYAWPGNVRELRNVMRQAILRGQDVIDAEELRPLLGGWPGRGAVNHLRALGGAPSPTTEGSPAPPPMSPPARSQPPPDSLKEIAEAAVAEAERAAIVDALKRTRGNKTQAARLLKIDFKTLHTKMKRLGLMDRLDEPE